MRLFGNMLKKKMFRDIKSNLSQFITIFLMILIGILAFTSIEAYMDGMQKTSDRFYEENNLQDLNVSGIFNSNDLDKIKEIDNISDAELKLSVTASGSDTTLLLNVIDTNNISKFYICEGEEFKNEKGESVRKDAKFDKQYLEGKYGADPYLRKIIDWGIVNG